MNPKVTVMGILVTVVIVVLALFVYDKFVKGKILA